MTNLKGLPRIACALSMGLGVAGLATPGLATNGYFSNGTSPESKGLAGAGAAVDAGILGLSVNPAMGTRTDTGVQACLGAFAPDRSVTIAPGGPMVPGTFASENKVFAVPCVGGNFRL